VDWTRKRRERLEVEKSKPKRKVLRAKLKKARESLRLSQSRMQGSSNGALIRSKTRQDDRSVDGGTVFPQTADRGKEPVRGRASAR
jgi:hypothetical protein